MKTTLKLAMLLGGAVAAMNVTAFAGPGPGGWPATFPTHVANKGEAMACCKKGEKVALACKDCKTVAEKSAEDKKGIASWFAPEEKHGCSGCGGKMTYNGNPAGKAPLTARYTHTCSKCGDKSAFTCATHAKS